MVRGPVRNVEKPVGRFLCVDPGIIGTGWALFDASKGLHPLKTDVVRGKRFGILQQERILGISRNISAVVKTWWVDTMVVEEPGLFAASGVSYAAAVKGDLFALSFLVGALMQVADTNGCKFVLARPMDWKGQMDKLAVKKRIERAFRPFQKPVTYRDHEMDAVGMGLSLMGVL